MDVHISVILLMAKEAYAMLNAYAQKVSAPYHFKNNKPFNIVAIYGLIKNDARWCAFYVSFNY